MSTFDATLSETNQETQKASHTHLLSGVTVLIILIVAAIIFDTTATSWENKDVHGLAPLLLSQVEVGSVIQQAAFRQTDLLPVFGSSEMVITQTPYRAFTLFSTYPTGFNIVDIAKAGDSNINIAQDLASLGQSLRGRKVVISFAPGMFAQPQTKPDVYAGNFSLMHASGLIFSRYLGITVKKEAAGRMKDYPETLNSDVLLQLAIYNLDQNTRGNDYFYYALYPFGQLDNFIFRLKDHFQIWLYENGRHGNLMVRREPRSIDWQAAITAGENEQKLATNNNPYGIDNKTWSHKGYMGFEFHARGSQDQLYLTKLKNSQEWGDLAILLEVLKELGAKPLILSRPINGTLYIASGISRNAQQAYYDKLHEAVAPYHFPVVDFQKFTNDPYFSVDYASHTSPKGWVIVDQVLDAFYHGQPLNW